MIQMNLTTVCLEPEASEGEQIKEKYLLAQKLKFLTNSMKNFTRLSKIR